MITFPALSHTTKEALLTYQSLVLKWNRAVNLVASSTLDNMWTRHFEDSMQVWDQAPAEFETWVDLGAGAGFPGMVAAILSSGQGRNGHFILVEVDRRKAEFLRTVSRETKVPVTVIEERAEECLPLAADIVSARALAPLELLLSYAQRHLKAGGTGIFLKGASYQDEINTARRRYRFDVKSVPSITESAARVLVVRGIKDV